MPRRTLILVALALFALTPGAPARASEPCAIATGQYVLLKSNQLDPDVFVWDSRFRLSSYAAGEWRNTQDVLDHTILSKPGTRGYVIQCEPQQVRFRYDPTMVQDAVGLKLTSGPQRGRYGWVASDDAHLITTAISPVPQPRILPRKAPRKAPARKALH